MTASARLRPHPSVVFTPLGDGTGVLLHLDTRFYFTLNDTARTVWESLTQRASTPDELVHLICARYATEVEQAARDLKPLLDELTREQLVEWVESADRGRG